MGLRSPSLEEKVDTSIEINKLGRVFIMLEEEAEKLENATKDFILMRKHIIEQLEGMENVEHYNILYGRFVKGWSFTEIGEERCYTRQRCFQIYGNAMDDFEKLYGKEYLSA